MSRNLVLAIALLTASTANSPAASTQWQDLGGGKARLIAVKDPQTGRIDGAVEIDLEKGWKTYWKSPGGSGIAPEFDFSRSVGFYAGEVGFPTPEWVVLPDASFFGYTKRLAFPFSGSGEQQSDLKLDLLIGVCEDICIPATASFAIASDDLNQSDSKSTIALELAQSTLPPTLEVSALEAAISRDDHEINLTYRTPEQGNFTVGVFEIPGRWVSDPAKVQAGGDGISSINFAIPNSVSLPADPLKWRVTLIAKSQGNTGEDARVERVVELAGN